MVKRGFAKKLFAVALSAALVATTVDIPFNNVAVEAATIDSIYGNKPKSQTVVYDLSSPYYLEKTVVFLDSVIASKPVYGEQKVNTIGCPDLNCPFFEGKVFNYNNGIKFVGDTDGLSFTNENVKYYVVESGKKTEKSRSVVKEALVNAGPVMIYGESGSEFIQTDVRCEHGFVGETHYNTFNNVVRVESLGGESFKVKYNLDGGVLPGNAQNKNEFYFSNKDYTYKFAAPVKLGYQFSSWGGSGLLWSDAKNITIYALTPDNWDEAKEMLANTNKLNAVWVECNIKLNFDPDYPGAEVNSTTRYSGNNLKEEVVGYDVDREGYKFKGWFIGDTEINILSDIPQNVWNAENEYTLKAKWEKVDQVVTTPTPTPAPVVTETPEYINRDDAMPDVKMYSSVMVVAPDFSDSEPLYDANNTGATVAKAGLTYDTSKNLLKVKNYSGSAVFAEAMGSAFTVDVSGENTMTQLYSISGGYNGSVTIKGDGTLNLTGTDAKEGLLLRAQATDTQLIIEDGVNLNVSAGTGKSAIKVIDSTNPEPIKLGTNESLNGGKITVIQTEGEDGITLYTAEIKSESVKISYNKSENTEKTVTVAKASVGKLASTKAKYLSVNIGKVANVDGYQIRYSLNKNMSKATSTTVTTTKKTFKKLKSGKKYYVQVRAYVLDENGKKIYGDWSAKKNIKVK